MAKGLKPAAAVVGLILVALIGFLLWSNYQAQVELQESASRQLRHDSEKLATTVGYFFSERKDDLKNLAESRELAIYFENKDLGMSMAYGLRASLVAIAGRFERLRDGKTFHGERIYERIVFLDKDGLLLADTLSAGDPGKPQEKWPSPRLEAGSGDPVIIAWRRGNSLQLVVSIAYFFKERYEGRILAFVSARPLGGYLMTTKAGGSECVTGLICEKGRLHVFAEHPYDISLPPLKKFPGAAADGSQIVDLPSGDGRYRRMSLLMFPVAGTSLSLAVLVPRMEIAGGAAPWRLSLAMGILILLAMGVAFILWRADTRQQILLAHLDESARREKEIGEANAQLREEMTERKRTEMALRLSEEKYRAIFESFQDVYLRTDRQGVVTVISPSIRAEGGYAPEEVTGRPVMDFFAEKSDYGFLMGELKKSGTVSDFELKLRGKDANAIHASMNAHAILDGDGMPAGVEGVLRNITRRKRDEEALKEGERRLDLALKGGDLGVWDWNVPTGKTSFNRRWARMLGYAPEEIEPNVSSWEKLIHPEDRPWVMETLHEHMEGRTPYYESEHRLKSKSGEWMWVLDRGQVVERDGEGRPVRIAGTHLDITPRKRAELELKKYQEDLERLVEERTSQLREAQKELISRAMESGRAQLSAMVLHNIGNAVTPLKVHLENMKPEKAGEMFHYMEKCYNDLKAHAGDLTRYVNEDARGMEVFDYMGSLLSAVEEDRRKRGRAVKKMDEAVSYISEVLTLQQAYAVREREMKESADLNAVINDAVSMQAGALDKRGIAVKKDLALNLKKLLIDKNRLMQVIVNFIKNSYEAIDELKGEEAGKWIRIRSFKENGRIGFEIADSGIGIAPDQLGAIFEYGKSNKGSSGFGLYYCKLFVEANRGVLDIRSDGTGKGATVRALFET